MHCPTMHHEPNMRFRDHCPYIYLIDRYRTGFDPVRRTRTEHCDDCCWNIIASQENEANEFGHNLLIRRDLWQERSEPVLVSERNDDVIAWQRRLRSAPQLSPGGHDAIGRLYAAYSIDLTGKRALTVA